MSIVDDIRPMPGPGSAFVSRPAKFKGGAQAQAPTMTHEQPKDMVEDDAQLERLMTTVGRHISQEEKKKQLEEKKAQRAAMQNDDPNARGRTRR